MKATAFELFFLWDNSADTLFYPFRERFLVGGEGLLKDLVCYAMRDRRPHGGMAGGGVHSHGPALHLLAAFSELSLSRLKYLRYPMRRLYLLCCVFCAIGSIKWMFLKLTKITLAELARIGQGPVALMNLRIAREGCKAVLGP